MDCRFFVFCGCKFVVGDYDDYGLGWGIGDYDDYGLG